MNEISKSKLTNDFKGLFKLTLTFLIHKKKASITDGSLFNSI